MAQREAGQPAPHEGHEAAGRARGRRRGPPRIGLSLVPLPPSQRRVVDEGAGVKLEEAQARRRGGQRGEEGACGTALRCVPPCVRTAPPRPLPSPVSTGDPAMARDSRPAAPPPCSASASAASDSTCGPCRRRERRWAKAEADASARAVASVKPRPQWPSDTCESAGAAAGLLLSPASSGARSPAQCSSPRNMDCSSTGGACVCVWWGGGSGEGEGGRGGARSDMWASARQQRTQPDARTSRAVRHDELVAAARRKEAEGRAVDRAVPARCSGGVGWRGAGRPPPPPATGRTGTPRSRSGAAAQRGGSRGSPRGSGRARGPATMGGKGKGEETMGGKEEATMGGEG